MLPVMLPEKVTISRTGMAVSEDLTFEEWASLGPILSEAAQSVAFVIGDWLLYGEDHFRGQTRLAGMERLQIRSREVSPDLYDEAVRQTRLDRSTLLVYAHVSRRVPSLLRNKDLSWEHHKIVAKLPPLDQQRWLRIAAEAQSSGAPISTRALRRSVNAGRMLAAEELTVPDSDKGIENHIPFVNRLVGWWARMREAGWLDDATPEQRAALKRDLEPIITIYNEL